VISVVDAVSSGRAVAHEVRPEPRQLALAPDARVGQPDRRDSIALGRHLRHLASILSVLHASRASPLTFLASATSTRARSRTCSGSPAATCSIASRSRTRGGAT